MTETDLCPAALTAAIVAFYYFFFLFKAWDGCQEYRNILGQQNAGALTHYVLITEGIATLVGSL